MGWEGTADEDVLSEPAYVSAAPFTREARQLEAVERELRMSAAAVDVAKLVLLRTQVRADLTKIRLKRL
jgi:hypothetical protein